MSAIKDVLLQVPGFKTSRAQRPRYRRKNTREAFQAEATIDQLERNEQNPGSEIRVSDAVIFPAFHSSLRKTRTSTSVSPLHPTQMESKNSDWPFMMVHTVSTSSSRP